MGRRLGEGETGIHSFPLNRDKTSSIWAVNHPEGEEEEEEARLVFATLKRSILNRG